MKYTLSICWSAHSLAVSSISYANLQNLLETSPCVEWWRNLGGSRGLSRHISETSEFWIQLQSSLHIRHLKHINKLRERDGPQSSIRVGRFLPWGVECFQVGNEQVSPFACVITLARHLTYADYFSFLLVNRSPSHTLSCIAKNLNSLTILPVIRFYYDQHFAPKLPGFLKILVSNNQHADCWKQNPLLEATLHSWERLLISQGFQLSSMRNNYPSPCESVSTRISSCKCNM